LFSFYHRAYHTTLHYTTINYITLYITLNHSLLHYTTLKYYIILYYIYYILYYTIYTVIYYIYYTIIYILYYILKILYYTLMLYYTMLYYTIQCYTILYYAILYYTIIYCIILYTLYYARYYTRYYTILYTTNVITLAFRVVMSPWRVGRHKYSRQDGSLEHDGFISSVLVLVFIVGFSVTVIISQFLSDERVEITHQVQPFVTQIFLTLLLMPGVATVVYSFKYRGDIKTVVHHPHTMSYPEIIKMTGMYIFASCAIAFDLFSVICEFGCLHGNIAGGVVDIIFYVSKAIFTLLQCLFIRKFLNSCFDSKPFLQVSLVSIMAANMAIWMYTTISKYLKYIYIYIYLYLFIYIYTGHFI